MVANKYAFLQITRRRFLNEWEAFKKVISRRNIRRRITIPLTLSNLKLLRRITRTENILHRNFTRRQVAIQNRVASNIGISQSTLDRKSGSAGMPRPISYAVFCLKKKKALGLLPDCRIDPAAAGGAPPALARWRSHAHPAAGGPNASRGVRATGR